MRHYIAIVNLKRTRKKKEINHKEAPNWSQRDTKCFWKSHAITLVTLKIQLDRDRDTKWRRDQTWTQKVRKTMTEGEKQTEQKNSDQ